MPIKLFKNHNLQCIWLCKYLYWTTVYSLSHHITCLATKTEPKLVLHQGNHQHLSDMQAKNIAEQGIFSKEQPGKLIGVLLERPVNE